MKMERMGFESNRRIVKVMNNQRVTATVGGKKYNFRSILEYRWARYLQFLKEQKQIKDWFYETMVFTFKNVKTAPVMYRPDFVVYENDGTVVLQETKGLHDGQTNKKFQRMAAQYPQYPLELVLQSISDDRSKGANRRQIAEKYVCRIIDASVIFRQIRGIVNLNPPIVQEL